MRNILKKLVQMFSLLSVIPLYWLMLLSEQLVKADQPFQGCSQLLSLFPGVIGNYLRQQFYVLTLDKCADDCCIEFGTRLNQRGIEIGRRVYVGSNCCIGLCRIQDDVMLGSNVDVISGKNQHND